MDYPSGALGMHWPMRLGFGLWWFRPQVVRGVERTHTGGRLRCGPPWVAAGLHGLLGPLVMALWYSVILSHTNGLGAEHMPMA